MSAEVTLTGGEREALTCDCESAGDGIYCPMHAASPYLSPDLSADYLIRTVERIVAARVEQARVDERERIAQAIEATYLGPDSGRGYDGSEAPDAHCRNAYDEGLYDAARIAREAGPS